MSHIDGSIGTLDLVNPTDEDWFKIGEAHGEQGWPQDPTYTMHASYLEGYSNGTYKRSYLFPGERLERAKEPVLNVIVTDNIIVLR